MTYSDILVANCKSTWMKEIQSAGEGSCIESGTWITHVSKLTNLEKPDIENPNLKNLEVEDCTRANDLGRIIVSTIDTDNVKFQEPGQGICSWLPEAADLLGFERSWDFDERAGCAGRVESLVLSKGAWTRSLMQPVLVSVFYTVFCTIHTWCTFVHKLCSFSPCAWNRHVIRSTALVL